MSFDEEPHFDIFSSHDGSTTSYGIVAAAIGGQVLATVFSIVFLIWTSPWLALGTTAFASVYLYHLAWMRALRFRGFFWRFCTAAAMAFVMLFAVSFVYLASR